MSNKIFRVLMPLGRPTELRKRRVLDEEKCDTEVESDP